MTRRFSALFALCLLLLSLPVAGASLQSYYRESRCDRFASVSSNELMQARLVFSAALKAEDMESPKLTAAWNELGFEWLHVAGKDADLWVAREQKSGCSGRGFYAFSSDSRQRTVLQVPHRFMDRYTGTIALDMARSGLFRAIAWNTVPRRSDSVTESRDADLAHRWDSYFVAFTEAFADVLADGRLIQLHGFAASKRKTADAEDANIIVSAGSHWPTVASRALSTCLETGFSGSVRLFPRDITELGGTRNVQGRLLRGLGHNGFVHVELSDSLRQMLGDDPPSLKRLSDCLTEKRR